MDTDAKLYSLPEAEGGGCGPELVELFLVTSLQECIVHNEKRVSRDVVGEGRVAEESGHVCRRRLVVELRLL